METSLLVEKLQARGIRLSLDNGQLNYSADRPIPTGIVTTLTVETPRIIRHLEGLTPRPVDAKPTRATSSVVPPSLLEELGDNAKMFAKALELFPPGSPIEWTPKAETKKAEASS